MIATVPDVRARGATATATSQVLLAVVAHLGVSGCLPGAAELGVALPLSALALVLTGRALRHVHPVCRLLAGQVLVHAVLGVTATCTAHGPLEVAHAASEPSPAAHAVMALVHLLVTALCLGLVGRCEAVAAAALVRADDLVVRALLRRVLEPVLALVPAAGRPPAPRAPLVVSALSTERAAQRGLRGPPRGGAPAPA